LNIRSSQPSQYGRESSGRSGEAQNLIFATLLPYKASSSFLLQTGESGRVPDEPGEVGKNQNLELNITAPNSSQKEENWKVGFRMITTR
jgi:hypothetical protein